MALLRLVPYGPPAARALRDAIVQAKRGDPLAPVTVAVPSNYAGLSLRRSLGIGDLSLAAVSGQRAKPCAACQQASPRRARAARSAINGARAARKAGRSPGSTSFTAPRVASATAPAAQPSTGSPWAIASR